MDQGTTLEPAAPSAPPPSRAIPMGGDPEGATSLLGPFLFGAACGWIVLSVVNLGELAFGFFRDVLLANALWLSYLQPAILLILTGFLAIRSVLRRRMARGDAARTRRSRIVHLALALIIAWAPYLAIFAIPRGILQLNSYRVITDPGFRRLLLFFQLALAPAAGWLTGLLAVFIWGRPGDTRSSSSVRSALARWLPIALVASLAFAVCTQLEAILVRAVDYILIAPVDPTCGGACTEDDLVNRFLLPLFITIALGALGGIVGGLLRFGRPSPRGPDTQPSVEQPAAPEPGSGIGDVPPAIEPVRHRALPGSRYWGSFLLGLLACGAWFVAIYLMGSQPPLPPEQRIPAQVVLMLVFPVAVILYSGLRLHQRGTLFPRQALYALLAVALALVGPLLAVTLPWGPNTGFVVLMPFYFPLFLPVFGPALGIGVAIGFAWGVRRPDEHHPVARRRGIGPALCGWVGFALPLAAIMVWIVAALHTHSITCGNFGGCVLAAAITFSSFEAAGIIMIFGLALILAGLAIGRSLALARRSPPAAPVSALAS